MSKEANIIYESQNWALSEFGEANLNDKRLSNRLVKIANNLVSLPESSINQACGSWSEAKAAYRFFQNENIKESNILGAHISKTIERAAIQKTILAIQDTSYISYTNHKKTIGLGILSRKVGINVKNMEAKGLIMHTTFGISPNGLALGILDQKIHSRSGIPEEIKHRKKSSHNNGVYIEDKESIKWLEALKNTSKALKSEKMQVVTICDREADMYDFYELAYRLNSAVLVRASQNREVNKKTRYSEKGNQRLWDVVQSFPCKGKIEVGIPAKLGNSPRKASLELSFGSFTMNPPRNNIRHKKEKLPNLPLHAVYVIEKNPPREIEPLEWLLLTNVAVNSFDEAIEKVRWYCLRWRIEVFHKILKSGLKVEQCRLSTAERLMRYLTVMSIIAWRIFFISLIARTDPNLPSTILLAEEERKVLSAKIYKTASFENRIPTIKEAILEIAGLGGYLARKNDPEPGPIVIWRGWKRLFDLAEGWRLAHSHDKN